LLSGTLHQPSGFFQPCLAGEVGRGLLGIAMFSIAAQIWFLENFANPYPDDATKRRLIAEANITERQLGNWLSNTRVRVWKPLLEKQRLAAAAAAAAAAGAAAP
jgi:hypothetical protein